MHYLTLTVNKNEDIKLSDISTFWKREMLVYFLTIYIFLIFLLDFLEGIKQAMWPTRVEFDEGYTSNV
jgi:hypothetical protein